MASEFDNKKVYYGIKNKEFENQKESSEGKFCYLCGKELSYNFRHFSQLGDYSCSCGFTRPVLNISAKNVSLFPSLSFDVEPLGKINLNGRGKYNIYNILAVASSVSDIENSFDALKITTKNYTPQAGRLEKFKVNGKAVYLLLAKNPAGFNQSVETVTEDPEKKDIIIAINDGIGDGKDVSWLWDVDFEDLINENTASLSVSGTRYADMGLRFKYSGVKEEEITLATDMKETLRALSLAQNTNAIYVLCNYTALFPTQAILKELEDNKNEN